MVLLVDMGKEAATKAKTSSEGKTLNSAVAFSEALEYTKFGKFNYFIIIVSGLVLANVVLETAGVAFLLPVAQCDLQLTNKDKGFLSAVGYAGIILSSNLWGFLADTRGRRRVIRPTLLAGFVVSFISSFSQTFWIMLLLRFVNGFFISGGSATIYAYLGEFHVDRTRSRAMMGSAFIFALGAMAMPFLAFMVINQDWLLPLPYLGIVYKPWRLFIIVCAIPGLFCGLSLFLLPESPKFLLSVGKEVKTLEVLQKIYRLNGGKDSLKISHIIPEKEDVLKVVDESKSKLNFLLLFFQTMWNQTVPLFRRKYLRSTLIVCTTQFWLYVITNGLYMWFPSIVNAMAEFMSTHPDENRLICQIVSEKQDAVYGPDGTIECTDKLENSTYMYSFIMEVLYALSFACIGFIINCVGKITILFIIIIFFSCCGLVAVLLPIPSIAAIFYVLLFVVGIAINVLGATTVDLYPTKLRAMAMCISLMVGRIGSVVGTNIVGALLASYCELTFYIACCAMMACAFLILFLPRRVAESSVEKSNAENP